MYFPQKFSFGDDFLAGIRDSAVMVARNRMCICSSLQTRKLFVLEIFLCCSQVTIQKILLFIFREPLPLLQRWKVIVVDLVGRVLHVSTNGAELDHKCIDPLNDQRAYFNTTTIFEKDIVLLKDICLPRAIWQQLDNFIDTCRSSDVDLKICLSESSFNCYLESECFSSLDLLQTCSAGPIAV